MVLIKPTSKPPPPSHTCEDKKKGGRKQNHKQQRSDIRKRWRKLGRDEENKKKGGKIGIDVKSEGESTKRRREVNR